MLYHLLFGRERSASVTVHERPDHARDRISRAEDLKFIEDGFDRGAFLVPPAFFLQHRLWWALLLYIAVVLGIGALYVLFSLAPVWVVVMVAALHALVGYEADELQRSQLDARGWMMIGQVTGTSLLDCERRFLDGWLTTVPISSAGANAEMPGTAKGAASATASTGDRKPALRRVLGNVLAPRPRH